MLQFIEGKNSEKGIDNSEKSGIIKSSPEERFNDKHDELGRFAEKIYVSATGPNEFSKGFSSTNLSNHWYGSDTVHSHAEEYRGFTMEQYAQRALELIQKPVGKNILGYRTKENEVVRYDIETNDFVKGNPLKGIKTMFKPHKGIDYFKKLKARESYDDNKLKEEIDNET